MNRVTISILLLLAAMALHVAGIAQPCVSDTLENEGGPGNEISWLQGSDSLGPCPLTCTANRFDSWQLPDSTQFIYLFANVGPPYPVVQVRIVKECHLVLWDSCLQVGPAAAGFPPINHQIPNDCQLFVYWDSTQVDSIGAVSKFAAVHQSPLNETIMDTDTCGVVLSIQQPTKQCEAHNYTSILTLAEYPDSQPIDLPAGLYWQWCEDKRIGKKVLVLH